jgi:hypothetical protein
MHNLNLSGWQPIRGVVPRSGSQHRALPIENGEGDCKDLALSADPLVPLE